jgi:ERCC4-related helicase
VSSLLPGTEVQARGLRWEVVAAEPAGEQTLYRLRCREQGVLLGRELDLLSPFEKLEPLQKPLQPERASKLDHWRVYHQAFLLEQALGSNALLAAQPGRLKLAPYQLVPVMRALRMSRPRLLLADAVGLGKTIEAGLILAELIARRRAHRILIVSPPGPLLTQWRDEMRERFGLRFEVMDRDRLQEIRREMELGANPFDREALALVSIDFAKQERVLEDLERTQYDLVVIDEAHHCAALGTAGDAEDSRRRRLAEVLSRRSDGLLLLTATPHDGFDEHFASIVELLDPSLLDGPRKLRGDTYQRHVVRRLKRHIKDPETGAPAFPEREVTPIPVLFGADTTPRFAMFQQGLLELIAPQVRRAMRGKRYGDVLAFFSLLKRSVSSIVACRNTLLVIGGRLGELAAKGDEDQETRRQRLRTLRDYRRRIERFGALSREEEEDHEQLEAEDMASELARADDAEKEVRRERDRMRRVADARDRIMDLARAAEEAMPEDPKLSALEKTLRDIRSKEPRANILVYTEYADSQGVIVERLRALIAAKGLSGEILALSGKDDDATRTAYTHRFAREEDLILVSTDATAEGLNLQRRCHHLVHFELPYNPNRLEQRNGRIDRFGQAHIPRVKYLYLAGTFEERLLLRLVAKYERQRRALGFVPNTLGFITTETDELAGRLLAGVADEQGLLFKQEPKKLSLVAGEDEDTSSPAYREMLAELEKAFGAFGRAAKSFEWLGTAGLAAEDALLAEADEARVRGGGLAVADLSAFVFDALRAEGRVVEERDGIFEIRLDPAWTFGLGELPGWDERDGVLRLTADVDRLEDAKGRALGFLGRAHPIVRRAIDRVRNVQFGGGDGALDRRVSAARGTGQAPELVATFLARIQSGAGRELERVIGVRVGRSGEGEAYVEAGPWLDRATPERAIATKDVWTRDFASWADDAILRGDAIARAAFGAIGKDFAARHEGDVATERSQLRAWVQLRADQICGGTATGQMTLLGGESARPRWAELTDPAERLAAFATDGANPARARQEADGVLGLYRGRIEKLERRSRLGEPEILPIGLLMLAPAGAES